MTTGQTKEHLAKGAPVFPAKQSKKKKCLWAVKLFMRQKDGWMDGWMANLWQELQDGSGVQRANGKSDEKGECVLPIVRLHERHDEDSGEGEGIDHCHTQERKAPHWGFE